MVEYSTNGGSSWNTIVSWSSDRNVHDQIDVTSYVAGYSNVKFAFHYIAYWDWYWRVDDVTVDAY